MVDKGIIIETQPANDQFISPIFVRIKKSGKLRIILDLKELNAHVPYKHFKMEMFEQSLKLVQPNMWMCSLDIKDAYYAVPIHESHQKYFTFEWNNKLYSFTCMPNGWANAPYVFTKILKPVFFHLRSIGHLSSYFIDDSILFGQLHAQCVNNCQDTMHLLTSLGFDLNLEKSIIEPTQIIIHLGNVIDSIKMIVYLPDERKTRIKDLCHKLIHMKNSTIRFVAKVIGTIIASFSALDYGRLHYRVLEKEKIKALKSNRGQFSAMMQITEPMRIELNWWIENLDTQVRIIQRPTAQLTIATDSSKTGWGCTANGESFNGIWSQEEALEHINVLELRAVLLSLQALRDAITGKHVQVLSDSTTAITYISKMGGLTSERCDEIAKEIWAFCIAQDTWVSCQHIPGKDNPADRPSRTFHNDLEWKLCGKKFKQICNKFGTPQIDLFASRNNFQLEMYCSWQRDPGASYIDAFTIDWSQFNLVYMFPPFSVIPRCLQKLLQDQAEGILIAPLWPQQVWFPKLLRALVQPPAILQHTANILSLAHSDAVHPLSHNLKLIACRVSGDITRCKAFLMEQSKFSWHPGEAQHNESTKFTWRNGTTFAVDGVSIHFLHL